MSRQEAKPFTKLEKKYSKLWNSMIYSASHSLMECWEIPKKVEIFSLITF